MPSISGERQWIDACRGATLQTTLAGGRTDGYDANYPADSISDEEWKILRERVADYVETPDKTKLRRSG